MLVCISTQDIYMYTFKICICTFVLELPQDYNILEVLANFILTILTVLSKQ